MASPNVLRINDPDTFVPTPQGGLITAAVAFPTLVPTNYDAVAMAYDNNGNLINVTYSYQGQRLITLLLTYDGSNNLTFVGKM